MKPASLIIQFLERKQQDRPGYSMRALARDLKCSPSFLSEVLASKKKVPPKWVALLVKLLTLDEISQSDLKKAVLMSHLQGSGLDALIETDSLQKPSKLSRSKPLNQKKSALLAKWYYIAVLDFLSLDSSFYPEDIAVRLGLSVAAIKEALKILEDLNLVKYDELERPYKTDQHTRFPTSKTDSGVRGFHLQMIEKAKYEVLNKTNDADFQRRLVTGTTMAVDPKHTDKIKKKIQSFLADIAEEFSAGNPQELYQFNVQLFPLTTAKKK